MMTHPLQTQPGEVAPEHPVAAACRACARTAPVPAHRVHHPGPDGTRTGAFRQHPLSAAPATHRGRCTTVVQIGYIKVVQTRREPIAKRTRASVRQSVTIPAQLAREVRRVAKERNVTMSRALVTLAERGVEAEAATRARLTAAYEEFMTEGDPARKAKVGEDLIRAIFGRAAIAEDSLR